MTRSSRRLTATLMLSGMLGLCAGAYGLLDGTAPRFLGLPAILAGAALCCAGLMLGGRRVTRTNYRPDPWLAPEWIVAGVRSHDCGARVRERELQRGRAQPVVLSAALPAAAGRADDRDSHRRDSRVRTPPPPVPRRYDAARAATEPADERVPRTRRRAVTA